MVELATSNSMGLCIVVGLMHCCWFELYGTICRGRGCSLALRRHIGTCIFVRQHLWPRLSIGPLYPRRLRLLFEMQICMSGYRRGEPANWLVFLAPYLDFMLTVGNGTPEIRAKHAASIDSLLALEVNMEELMDEAAGLILIDLYSMDGLMHCCWVSFCHYDTMLVRLPLAIARAYLELHIDITEAMADLVDGSCMYTREVIAWNFLEEHHS